MKEKNSLFQPHEIIWDSEKVVRLWNHYSEHEVYQAKYFGRQSGKEVASILRKLLFKKVKSILDFSCGKGDLIDACLPYLNKDQKIYASDISSSSIEATSKKLNDHPSFMGATLIDKLPSSLLSDQFDLVLLTEVIEHLNDDQIDAVLDEIYRITKPAGFILITTPYQENLGAEKTICPECGCIFHRWQHLKSWSLENLIVAVEKHGFKKIQCKNIQWGPLLLKIYFKLTGRDGNGIYYIGQKNNG